MVYRNVEELATEIYESIAKVTFVKGVSLNVEGPILKARILIEKELFISVFFNSETGTVSYTLVKGKRRVFGVDRDSVREWHRHELERPDEHVPCKPTRFKEFLEEVSRNLDRILSL